MFLIDPDSQFALCELVCLWFSRLLLDHQLPLHSIASVREFFSETLHAGIVCTCVFALCPCTCTHSPSCFLSSLLLPSQLVEAIWTTVDTNTYELIPSMLPLVRVIVPAIMELRPRFTLALHRAQAGEESYSGTVPVPVCAQAHHALYPRSERLLSASGRSVWVWDSGGLLVSFKASVVEFVSSCVLLLPSGLQEQFSASAVCKKAQCTGTACATE